MRRRDFIKCISSAAAAWPVAAHAQQPRHMPVIGYLGSSSFEKSAGRALLNFKRGLADTGYVEDRNVVVEYRWADDRYDRLPALAAELVQRRVTVLVAGGTQRRSTMTSAPRPRSRRSPSDAARGGRRGRVRRSPAGGGSQGKFRRAFRDSRRVRAVRGQRDRPGSGRCIACAVEWEG